MLKVTPAQKSYIAIATFVLLLFGAFFLRSYFSMFFVSGVLAFLFWPVFEKIRAKRGEGSAVALTILISAIVVIVPLVLLLLLAFSQLSNSIDNLNNLATTADFSKIGQQTIDTINNALSHIPFINVTITEQSLESTLTSLASSFGNALLDFAKGATAGIASFFTSLIIFIFVYISAFRNGESIIRVFKDINPLGKDISELYITKVAAMIKGTVRGQFIIAICQGFVGALSLYIAGVHGFFAVSFILFSALCVIPLGSGIVLIPTGILMILFGNISGGIILLGTHFLITTNIDNILRPRLVPQEARLDPALMIVSVFAGIKMLGFLGIIVGPTIMIIIVTTVRVYLQVYRDYEEVEIKAKKDGQGLFNKVQKIGNRIVGRKS